MDRVSFFSYRFKLVCLVAVVAMITAISSCSTPQVVETSANKSTEKEVYYNVTVIRDTLLQRDSVYHYEKGDTILIEKWHNVYNPVYKTQIVTDTIVKTDTITNTIQVPQVADNKVSFWQRLYEGFMSALIFLVVCVVLYNVIRYIIKK